MTESVNENNTTNRKPYLTALGAFSLAFGCAVGWGSFVMPGSTFLPVAGPIGTAIGLGIGGLVMLIIALNFQKQRTVGSDRHGISSDNRCHHLLCGCHDTRKRSISFLHSRFRSR